MALRHDLWYDPSVRSLLGMGVGVLLMLGSTGAQATTLLAVGGGDIPPEAARRFVAAAGGTASAKILVITWATAVPDEAFPYFAGEMAPYIDLSHLQEAERVPVVDRARLLGQLRESTAVFFTGGDQAKIMKVLFAAPEIADALRDLYARGIPIGGTSAGAAMMSLPMFTGDDDPAVIDPAATGLAVGLGLIPNVILDTHYIRRQRENRLFGAILGAPSYVGIGIDENNALWIEDNHSFEVMGPTHVMVVRSDGPSELRVRLYSAGEKFDLLPSKR